MFETERKLPSTPIKNYAFDPSDYSFTDSTKCDHCHKIIDESDKNGYWLVNECWHSVSKECLRKHVNIYFIREKGQVKCPVASCQQIMKEEDLTVNDNNNDSYIFVL